MPVCLAILLEIHVSLHLCFEVPHNILLDYIIQGEVCLPARKALLILQPIFGECSNVFVEKSGAAKTSPRLDNYALQSKWLGLSYGIRNSVDFDSYGVYEYEIVTRLALVS